ncbi:tetratricopeptide repeat protein [Litoribacter ruber]|uniref:Tetratricopeptide repeat protein n=1 Tax=Litoribacter ruber TaxID=702568 RepID=A0AAP2CH48_9BACT|nr:MULTISPECIES: tetratricopeptide repeat protein [Litoribacter]MBS9524596.1 tetratricopeptide repeat protein [Litoribacter alkaliphilus]MBT0810244.1 tetratricopeptide repeat protein [Litoribacter ruber]
MRKLILSLVLVAFATGAFAQKKVVRSAERNFKKGQYEEALTDIEAALQSEETGDDPNTHMVKGKIKTMMFEQDENNNQETVSTGRNAYDSFEKAMELDGNDKSSKIGKEIYKEVLPGMPENLQGEGILRLKAASLEKAIERYEEDDMELAHEFFSLAADIDPADTSMVFNAGYTANMIEKYEPAKKYFTQLLDDEEYNKLNAYYFLIQIATSVDEDQEEAYRLVSEAREEYPTDKGLQEFEIQLLLQLDKMDEAMASIEKALEEDPNDTAIRLRYGYLKEQSGDLEGALEEYKKTVESDPEFFEGNFYAGAIYLDKARTIIADVNNLPDDEWEAKSDDMLKEADGYYESSIPYFTKASELQPENTEVLEILFQIHTRLKNTEKAEEYDQKLQELLGPDWMEG